MGNGNGAAVGFRTLQTILDLRQVAASASPMTRHRIAAGVSPAQCNPDHARAHVDTLIFEERCRISSPETAELHPAILLIATLPDDDFDAFLASTAILVADRLQGGRGKDDLYWHWDAFHGHYGMAPAPIRAAILQGYRAMMKLGLMQHDQAPEDHLACSARPADVMNALLQVLARAGEDTLAEIAATGPASEKLLCRATLREVIELQEGILQPGQEELPGAALRSAARDPENPGFAAATACLLANEILRGDRQAWPAEAWVTFTDPLLKLPEPIAAPLIGAIRHLYERGDWDPYPGQVFDLLGDGASPIPGYADLSTARAT